MSVVWSVWLFLSRFLSDSWKCAISRRAQRQGSLKQSGQNWCLVWSWYMSTSEQPSHLCVIIPAHKLRGFFNTSAEYECWHQAGKQPSEILMRQKQGICSLVGVGLCLSLSSQPEGPLGLQVPAFSTLFLFVVWFHSQFWPSMTPVQTSSKSTGLELQNHMMHEGLKRPFSMSVYSEQVKWCHPPPTHYYKSPLPIHGATCSPGARLGEQTTDLTAGWWRSVVCLCVMRLSWMMRS